MTSPEFVFRRYLSEPFTQSLQTLVENNGAGLWWRDVLIHRDLKLAIRKDAIDVYHRGARIFHIAPSRKDGRVVPQTHFKYLVRRRQDDVVIDADGKTFAYPPDTFWTTYEEGLTLEEMVAASRRFAGDEKSDLHALIMHPRVIDLEIAFRSQADTGLADGEESDANNAKMDSASPASSLGTKFQQDRLDAATLEDRRGDIWVVFHEAKHFKNKELRAKPSLPLPVGKQIDRYRRSLTYFAPQIAESYREVCHALRELHAMRIKAGATRMAPIDPLIERTAKGEKLHVDCEPRLIVFGFDNDQKEGALKRNMERMEKEGLTVYAVGDPKAETAAAAFKRQKKKPSHAPSTNNDL